jgi:hypothetical protein
LSQVSLRLIVGGYQRDGFKSKLAAADVVYGCAFERLYLSYIRTVHIMTSIHTCSVNALLEQHEDKEGLDASVVTVQNYWRAFSALSG